MKRGFLKSKKAQSESFYPSNPSPSNAPKVHAEKVATPAPAASIPVLMVTKSWTPGDPRIKAIKLPHRKMEDTALPTSYIPTEISILEYNEKNTDHSDNSLFVTTVPSRGVGEPADPDGHSEWLVRGSTKQKILNEPGYPQPVPKPPGNIKSHVVKSTPTMGQGVFATRDIPMGEIIFAERPLLVAPRSLVPAKDMYFEFGAYNIADYAKIVMFEREKQLEAAVGRMDPDRKARFMALTNSHLEDGSGPIHGIIQTNGYGADNFWDGNIQPDEIDPTHQYFFYSVVCEIGSRINHSCLPNVTYAFKLSAFAMVFMASRDIKAGDQLFFSYCDPEQPASKRRADLAPYGIAQCICSSCVNATPETDNIRTTYHARLAEYERRSLTWNRLGSVPAGTLQQLVRYQSAVVEEGFDTDIHYWGHFLPVLIKAYKWSGNTREAKRLLHMLLRWNDFTMKKEAIEASG